MTHFNGVAYDPELDKERLTKQIGRVYDCMKDGDWKTLVEIEMVTGDPQASISAQMRNLRKTRFGGFVINRRRAGDGKMGTHEYQLLRPETDRQMLLI